MAETLNSYRYRQKLVMNLSKRNYVIYKHNNDVKIEHKRNCLQSSKYFVVWFN